MELLTLLFYTTGEIKKKPGVKLVSSLDSDFKKFQIVNLVSLMNYCLFAR